MIIKFAPVVALREEKDFYLYHTANDILYVTKGDITEEFDFTYFPDGVAQNIVSDHFEPAPVKEAKRVDGILYVTVERTLPETASEKLSFPKPLDTSYVTLDTVENDPLYIELLKQKEEETPKEVPTEPELPQEEEPVEGTPDIEEEELGDPEVIKLTEHEYSKEENIDYTPIVDEVLSEHVLEPVPDTPDPEPIEPDDDLLKTPEFTDIESALEQAFLEEEERKLQEELARQRELEEKLMEEQMAEQLEGLENGEGTSEEEPPTEESPLEDPVEGVPTIDDYPDEDSLEPPHSDEVTHSEDLEVGEYDYASGEETALEGNTDTIIDTGSEVDNNG